jgi:hypothetical protein
MAQFSSDNFLALWEDIVSLPLSINGCSHSSGQPPTQMPVVLKIDPQRQVVYSAFYGRLTEEEMIGHRAVIATDPDFKPHFNEIIDFTAVTEANVSEATLRGMAANPSLYHATVLHIVVAPAEALFQIASKYRELVQASRPNLFVVRTRAEAYELLPDTLRQK